MTDCHVINFGCSGRYFLLKVEIALLIACQLIIAASAIAYLLG